MRQTTFKSKSSFQESLEFHACFSGINPHSTFGAKLPFLRHGETKQRHLDLFSSTGRCKLFHSAWGNKCALKYSKLNKNTLDLNHSWRETFNTVNSLRESVQKIPTLTQNPVPCPPHPRLFELLRVSTPPPSVHQRNRWPVSLLEARLVCTHFRFNKAVAAVQK